MVRVALLVLLPAALIAAIGGWLGGGSLWSVDPDLPAPFPSPLASWPDHVDAIDAAIDSHRGRGASEPTDWISPGAEAAAWLNRATLTGRWQDYAGAETALDLAMRRAPPSAAPHPLAAKFALAVHRNAAVEPALIAARADREFALPAAQADAATMRGDVALYRGDWRQADTLYQRAQQLADDPSIRFRRAFIVERTGDPDAAIAIWINAARSAYRPSRRLLATVASRIGNIELARGRWDEAADWYARSERLLPGDWRTAALRLQMRALRGDLSVAIAGMARLAAIHDRPELWDALSAWRRAAGDSTGAALASARAAAGWSDWLARFPEAAAAHAAEHALLSGERPAAVAFARANFANRPYGDATILLVTALSANGETGAARALLERTLASGWRSTESDRLAFELAALAGDGEAAEAARAAALARNPRAFDPAARLILFGLH